MKIKNKLFTIGLAMALTIMPLTVHASGNGPRCSFFYEPVTITVKSVPRMDCFDYGIFGKRCSTIIYAGPYSASLYTRTNLTGKSIIIQGCANYSGHIARTTIVK